MKKLILFIFFCLFSILSFSQSSKKFKSEYIDIPLEVKTAAIECKSKSNGDRNLFYECMDSKGFKIPIHKESQKNN